MERERCSSAGRAAVHCALGADLGVTITVDDVLRTRREE